MTAKYLRNADMEQGMKYWSLEGEKVLSKNRKNPATQVGFHGMNQGLLEAWNYSPNMPLSNSTTMQRMHNLPNGTYVFGAYVGATKQNGRKNVATAGQTAKWEYWSNRDSIYGVSLYANADAVPVATDNPDYGANFGGGLGQKWAHSSKFNVATTVTDGTLEVGIRVDSTNANYVVWDNATLYYFGDMSEAEALDAMAEIDMVKAVAIADTLRSVRMNVDTLANLNAAIDMANSTQTTAATLWDDNENLFWNMGLARKSEADYKNLAKSIEAARVVAEGEWLTEVSVDLLNEIIVKAEAAYEVAVMNREELVALRKELSWGAGDVIYDSVVIAKDALYAFIEEAKSLEGAPGGYSGAQIAMLEDLEVELSDTMVVYEGDAELDFEDRTVDPNSLYPYIARVYETIENVRNNPISVEYTRMPIEFKRAEDGWIEGAEWYSQADRIIAYNSPMYRFEGKIETFRITVKKNKNNAAYFCLSELTFFDGNGNVIPLSEENVTSNADHVGNHPEDEGPEGNGIPALFDDDTNTFFHSEWKNNVGADHYLEVNLPNGGYDAFSFRMLSRDNSNGWDQSHTFPGEMIISTPAPKRDALERLVNQAKAYNAYSFPEVGYYEEDYSYLTDAIAKAEALIANYPSEEECRAMNIELRQAVLDFEANENKAIRLPEAGKAYRIVSAFPAFNEKQSVEKAITVNAETNTLWWENVAADRLQQEFFFEPVLSDDGEQYIEVVEEGTNEYGEPILVPHYCYYMKHVETGCYVDYSTDSYNTPFVLIEEPADTVMLKSLGRGQWNIMTSEYYYDEFSGTYTVNHHMLHCGDHNSGNPSSNQGVWGGTYGISSGICTWAAGINSASAWYIREMPELPLEVPVEGAEYKSEFFHFEAANTITLTADKACAFANLALYDRYDAAIAIDSLVVSGNTATIVQQNNLVACAFAFTNHEGVAEVTFNAAWTDPIPAVAYLQEAYDAAVAFAPIEGTEVGQFADLTDYYVAIGKADSILATGVTTHEEAQAMIEQLEAAVAGLVPNMPEAGRLYYIINAMESFENNNGVSMMMYDDEQSGLYWTYENLYEFNRCWLFEQATEEELYAAGMATGTCAYYIKNVATGNYIGAGERLSAHVPIVDDKSAAIPYVVTVLSNKEIALDGLGQSSKRLHTNRHGGGSGRSGDIVYWSSGAGTASAWRICDAETYGLSGFVTYAMEAQAVEATPASVVNIPIVMTNTTAVTAFQFDLYLPDGVSVVSAMEDDELIYDITFNDERAERTHVLAASLQADGALRVVAYSTADAAFVGDAGVVVNVAVLVDKSVAEGSYPVTLRNIRMVKKGASEVLGADHTSALTVYQDALMGDVNGDGNFTMIDVVMTVNAVLEKEQTGFNANAADLNGDGQITMVDVVGVLQLVLTDSSSKAPVYRDSNRTVSMPVLNACDLEFMGNGGVVLPVALCNGENYSAFQLDVQLPAGVELTDVELAGRAKASHTMAWNTLSDGTIRVVAYAMDNASFNNDGGALLNLVLNTSNELSADAEVVLTDGLFASVDGLENRAPAVNVLMRSDATYVDGTVIGTFRVYGTEGAVVVECGTDTAVSIYAATGRLVRQATVEAGKSTIILPSGVYVVNGNKVIVK